MLNSMADESQHNNTLLMAEQLFIAKSSQQYFSPKPKKHRNAKQKMNSKHNSKSLIMNIIPNTSTDYDLQETLEVENEFKSRLAKLKALQIEELRRFPKHKPHLHIILNMPNVLRCIGMVERNYRYTRYQYGFDRWMSFLKILKIMQKSFLGKKQNSAIKIQKEWRKYFKKGKEEKRRLQMIQFEKKMMKKCVLKIERMYLNYVYYVKEKKERFNIDMFWKLYGCVRIQKRFRGVRVRCKQIVLLKHRIHEFMRDWAQGNCQKLLERSGLQDIKTIALITNCINVISISSYSWRQLPKLKYLRNLLKMMERRREVEAREIECMKNEYILILKERSMMSNEDKCGVFKRYYHNLLEELKVHIEEAKKAVEDREKEERRQMSIRSQMNNVAEFVNIEKMSERIERETMFRAEYTQRRVENIIKRRDENWHQCDHEIMIQEDFKARALNLNDKKEWDNIANKYYDWEKNKLVKENEMLALNSKPGGSNTSDRRSQLSNIFEEVISYEKLLQEFKNGILENHFNLSHICNCTRPLHRSKESRSKCIASMKSCLNRVVNRACETRDIDGCIVEFNYEDLDQNVDLIHLKQYIHHFGHTVTEHFQFGNEVEDKYKKLFEKVQRIRIARAKRQLSLNNARLIVQKFQCKHKELLQVRTRLRTEKIGTRNDRKKIMDIAILLENELLGFCNQIISLLCESCEAGKEEMSLCIDIYNVDVNVPISPPSQHDGDTGHEVIVRDNVVTLKPKNIKSGINQSEKQNNKQKFSYLKERKKSKVNQNLVPVYKGNTKSDNNAMELKLAEKKRQEELYIARNAYLEFLDEEEYDEITIPYLLTKIKGKVPPEIAVHSVDGSLLTVSIQNVQSAIGMETNVSKTTEETASSKSKSNRDKMESSSSRPSSRKSPNPITKKFSRIIQVKQDHDVPETVKDTVKHSIPGLSLFTEHNCMELQFITEFKQVCVWSANVTRWINKIEKEWKDKKTILILHYLQRALYLLNGGKYAKEIKPSDPFLPSIAYRAEPIDLYELLLCRKSFWIKPMSNSSNCVVNELHVTSRTIDEVIGGHTFSIISYFLLVKSTYTLYSSSKKWIPQNVLENSLFHRLGLVGCSNNEALFTSPHFDVQNKYMMEYQNDIQHVNEIELCARFSSSCSLESEELDTLVNLLVVNPTIIKVYRMENIGDNIPSASKIYLGKVDVSLLCKLYREWLLNNPDHGDTKYWVPIPPWMFPVYYTGNHLVSKIPFWKRSTSIVVDPLPNKENANEVMLKKISRFEHKLSKLGKHLITTLRQNIISRKVSQQRMMERALEKFNLASMDYEDRRVKLIVNIEKEMKYQDIQAVERKRFIRRITTCLQRDSKISPGESQSIENLNYNMNQLRTIKPPLPLSFKIDRSVLEYCISFKGLKSVCDIDNNLISESITRLDNIDHVKWIDVSKLEVASKSRRYVYDIPKKYTPDVRETIAGGGLRNISSFMRCIVDVRNNPRGSTFTNHFSFNRLHCDDKMSNNIRNTRVGYQNRRLCESNYRRYACSMSNKGRYFSEYGYRVLRTQIPNKELDTVEHFSHIFNQLNIETRYHDINVDVSVIKMQSIWRRKVACSKLLRMKMEQKQM